MVPVLPQSPGAQDNQGVNLFPVLWTAQLLVSTSPERKRYPIVGLTLEISLSQELKPELFCKDTRHQQVIDGFFILAQYLPIAAEEMFFCDSSFPIVASFNL
jgi:hypothetical protein